MMDVAIVGVGLHPFGRFAGVSGIEMGAIAIRRALATQGASGATSSSRSAELRGRQSRCGRCVAGSHRDPVHRRVQRVRDRGQCAHDGRQHDPPRDCDLGVAVGMDKHIPGAFTADPRLYACPSWYGEVGQFITTKFFGMKINKYMHDHGISHETLARVAAKNLRNGVLNPSLL